MGRIVGIDLFCGCGGLTRGLSDAGIHMVKGIDIDETARETFEKNNPETVFEKRDIRSLTAKELLKGVDRNRGELLIAGCAPCQPFSRHTVDSRYDRRKSLMWCFADFVKKLMPEYVLVENVPGFRRENNPYHDRFIRTLKEMNYHFDEGTINAANYGVPQSRLRYVLLGSRTHEIKIPVGKYGTGQTRLKTVRNAIKKYPRISAGESYDMIPNHSACRLSDTNMKRIKMTPQNGGSRTDVSKELTLNCHKTHRGHSDVYGRMYWDRPSPTLTCRCNSFSNGRFGHPSQDRSITVREAATLQTFPDDYVFYSCQTNNAKHVGNAVPVMLAKKLGRVFTKLQQLQ